MSATVINAKQWTMSRDKEGHRTYDVVIRVKTTDPSDGPYTVLAAAGMPSIGVPWSYGNDYDLWALRTPEISISPVIDNEPNKEWEIGLKYTTRPGRRCQDTTIEDPLLEPPTISGSFTKQQKEQYLDKDGNKITTSSHEIIRGDVVTFDYSLPTVNISFNSATIDLAFISERMDGVNDAIMWGCEPRCVKLSTFSWQRKLYGTCSYYYTHNYGFDINFDTFDRKTLDEGTKILDPDLAGAVKTNPAHFVRYKDANGENTKILLDGNGSPLGDNDPPVEIDIKRYKEYNLLELGIPSTF